MLLGTYWVITQFVPLETKVHLSPELANKIDVFVADPSICTTFEDAETTVKAW